MLRAAADRAASEAGPDPFAYDTKHALSSRSLLKSGAVAESTQLGARLSSLAKVGPMALIQFIDFATDVMVIIELFRDGEQLYAYVGIACVCASIGLAVVLLLLGTPIVYRFEKRHAEANGQPLKRHWTYIDRCRDPILASLLAPLNLHLFYIGSMCGRAEAAGDAEAVTELHTLFASFKTHETLFESVPMLIITLIATSRERAADSQMNVPLLWASMGLSMVSLTYGIFVSTSNHERTPQIRKSHKATQFLATGVDMLWFLGVFFTAGQMSTAVIALLVGLYSTVGIGTTCAELVGHLRMATRVPGSPEALLLNQAFPAHGSRGLMHYMRLVFFATIFLCLVFPPFCAKNGFPAFVFLGAIAPGKAEHDYFIETNLNYVVMVHCVRGLGLLLVAVISLYETGWPLERTIALAALAPAWVASMRFLYYQLGHSGAVAKWRNKYMRRGSIQPTDAAVDTDRPRVNTMKKLRLLRQASNAFKLEDPHAAQLRAWSAAADDGSTDLEGELKKSSVEELQELLGGTAAQPAIEDKDELVCAIIAKQLLLKLQDTLESVLGVHETDKAERRKAALIALHAAIQTLLPQLGGLSLPRRRSLYAGLCAYTPAPGGDGAAEDTLRTLIEQADGGLVEPEVKSLAETRARKLKHPLRAVPLANMLLPRVWGEAPSFFGTGEEETKKRQNYFAPLWQLGRDVSQGKKIDYFLSHAWVNGSERKVAMLREFLCLAPLLGQLIVTSFIMSVFLVPLGLAIAAYVPAFPPWLPCIIPLAALGAALLWIYASIHGCVPASYVPWALSGKTLWLDRCCVCQKSAETAAAGVRSFREVLLNCNCIVVFASAEYFRRLWCVYELAVFARTAIRDTEKAQKDAIEHNQKNALQMPVPNVEEVLSRRILILSLDWPGSLSCSKVAGLTDDEKRWLKEFSCRKAECFKPSDRATVLAAIRAEWGTKDESGEAVFDAFVQTKLVEIFAKSKQAYQKQLARTMYHSFELSFGG